MVDRHAPSRSYKVYAAPSGRIFQSRLGAWRFYDTSGVASIAPVVEPSALQHPPSPASYRISLGPSTELVMLAASVGLAPTDLPKGVLDCIQASRSPLVPQELCLLATDQVLLFGRERISSAGPPLPTLAPVAPASSSAHVTKEIELLRQELPPGCEKQMFGSEHGFNQLPSTMRYPLLLRKYLSIAGRNGQACARDRRALSRYKSFCARSNITPPFPQWVRVPFLLLSRMLFFPRKGRRVDGRLPIHSRFPLCTFTTTVVFLWSSRPRFSSTR